MKSSELDTRFGKPKCIATVGKDGDQHRCGLPQWKDGLCKRHHKDGVSETAATAALRREVMDEQEYRYKTRCIERAIVLLVQNGYRVERVMPHLALSVKDDGQHTNKNTPASAGKGEKR